PAQLFHSWIAALARRPWLPSESPNDLIARHRHPPSGRATFQHRPPRHEAEPQAIVEHREVLAGRHGPVRALAVDIATMCGNKTRAGSFEEDEPRVDHDAATRAGYVCAGFEGASRSRFDEYFRRPSAR